MVKDEFLQVVERALACVLYDEPYIMLGDFNARVGSRDGADDPWGNVRGPHGYGNVNDAGKELLAFLAANEATICNTWFCKRDIYKRTWMHPRSKQWHCIESKTMRQKDRSRCLDVTVKRGAECNSDHQLLCMKLRMRRIRYPKRHSTKRLPRYDVSALSSGEGSTADQHRPPQGTTFCEQVTRRAAAMCLGRVQLNRSGQW